MLRLFLPSVTAKRLLARAYRLIHISASPALHFLPLSLRQFRFRYTATEIAKSRHKTATMPSTNIGVAWALPVKVEVLGAHLEAYHLLHPIRNTIRLCNRYGQGPEAHITKLPIEMLDHIEAFLTQAYRDIILPQWRKDFRCWEDRCEPIDHLVDWEILNLYNGHRCDIAAGSFSDEKEYDSAYLAEEEKPDAHEVTEDIHEKVKVLIDDDIDIGDTMMCCREGHEKIKTRWQDRVGKATEPTRGYFSHLEIILKRDFGLEVWISHVQRELRYTLMSDDDFSHSTLAYLRLPSIIAVEHVHEPEYSGIQAQNVSCVISEVGTVATYKVPETPSKKSLARFDLALKALDLEVAETKDEKIGRKTSTSGVSSVEASGPLTENDPKPSKLPQLKMFVRSWDEERW